MVCTTFFNPDSPNAHTHPRTRIVLTYYVPPLACSPPRVHPPFPLPSSPAPLPPPLSLFLPRASILPSPPPSLIICLIAFTKMALISCFFFIFFTFCTLLLSKSISLYYKQHTTTIMETLTTWFNSLDPMLRVFWGITIFSTIIFVVQTIMSFIGIGDVETDFDADIDCSTDSLDDAGAMHLLSIRNIIYFLMGMGWAGVSMWHTIENRILLAIFAIFIGCVFVAVFITIFKQMMKLQHNGAFDINDALGKTVDVYLRIPANAEGMGKVQVSFNGSIQEIDARTNDDTTIPSGSKVRVVEVLDKKILVVEKV